MENNTPLSRVEDILQSTIDNTEYNKPPQSRVESLLIELKEVIGGGGSSAYHPAGSVDYVSELPSPSADYLGYVYDVTQDFTTTSDFKEGAGKRYPAGSNIAIVDVGTPESPSYKYDVLSGFIDTSNFVEKEEGKGLSTNDYTDVDKTKLGGIAEGAEVNVQSDWNESDNSSDAYIQNKPTLGTASALNVAESGNAGDNEVVKGNDSRLSDPRTPTTHSHTVSQITDFPTLGTAAGLDAPTTGDASSSEVVKGNDSRVVNSPIADSVTGINPTITDSADGLIQDLTVYGRSDVTETGIHGIGEDGELEITTANSDSSESSTTTVTISIPLYSAGDVKDEWNEKRGVMVKRCGKVVFNGSEDEDWQQGTPESRFYIIKDDAALGINIFAPGYISTTAQVNGSIRVNLIRGYNSIDIRDDGTITTLSDWKAHLASNPLTIIYELAEPYETPLTASELSPIRSLKTYTPTTNVTVTDDPTVDVGYLLNTANGQAVADVQNEIDNRKTEIDDTTPSDTKTYSSNKINALIQGSAWKFGYDIVLSDENPVTRVIYPPDVDNYLFTPAYMDFANDAFNYGSWNIRPGEKFMPKPCMLKYDGSVDYFLDTDDNTKKEDSTASDVANTAYGGNAMIQWGLLYIKRWESNGIYHFRVSNEKLDADYECWSNYDTNNNVIPHFYTSVYFGGDDGSGKMRSLSGISNYVNHTAAEEITAAMANGDDWYTEVFADQKLLEDLAVMMAKTTDVQTAYGKGRSESNSALAPGALNTKGMFWGENAGTGGVKLFGMENPFGNIWRRKAGYMMINGTQYVKMTRGTKDGSTAVDYNTTGAGYIQIPSSGITGTSGGYISSMMTTPYGRLPKVVSGSQTTYEADGCWWNGDGTKYAFFGGAWSSSRRVGVFCVDLDYAPSFVGPGVGASLSYKPRG